MRKLWINERAVTLIPSPRPAGSNSSSGSETQVRIWNFKDAREIYCLREHKKWTRHLIWRPRAKEEGGGFTLLSASDDGTVHGWDPNTGDCLYCLEGHTKPINRMSMSPNGALLATASVDHTVRLWDLRNRQIVRVLEGHTGPVMSCVFCGQDRLVSGSWDTTVSAAG